MSAIGAFPRPTRAARVPWSGSSSGASLRGVSLLLVGTVLSFAVGWFLGAHSGGQQPVTQLQQGPGPRGSKGLAAAAAGGSWTLDAAVQQAADERKRLVDQQKQRTPSYKPLIASVVTKCDNTCPTANDGVCDEGRKLQAGDRSQAVKCDLGTDCADCGAYTGPMYPSSSRWPQGGPVAHLIRRGVKVMTTMTVSQPSFQVLFTDPQQDLDVSSSLARDRILESGITQLFYEVLVGRCNTTNDISKRPLVLDVGANFGYFAAYAAKFGCRVIAWEPIPHFQAFVYQMLMLNNVTDLVMMRERVVTEEDEAVVPMQAPTRGIWGTASIMGINQNADQVPANFDATSERVDSVVNDDVLLMKVDVEGFESSVIKSANRLFTTKDVKNVVLEYNPGVAEGSADDPKLSHLVTANPLMLMELLFRGYRIGLMTDGVAKPGWAYHRWNLTLPALPEITTDILRHDLDDAHIYVKAAKEVEPYKHGVGCPPDPKLLQLHPKTWAMCNLFPENAHPQGARSYFPYNTNLWISKEEDKLKLKGVVGILETWQDPNSIWSNPEQEFVTGQRSCKYLPLETMVRNRCSCNWAVKRNMTAAEVQQCRTEEAAVMEALKAGRIKFKP